MSSMIGSMTPQCEQLLAISFLLLLPSAEIRASAGWSQNVEAQSPYNPACSLSTLVRCRYRHHPKTRYWWVANPCQTGFAPVRLLALRLGAQFRFVRSSRCSNSVYQYNPVIPSTQEKICKQENPLPGTVSQQGRRAFKSQSPPRRKG